MQIEQHSEYLKVVRLPCFDFAPRYFWFQLQNLRTLLTLTKDCTILHGVNPISSVICAYLRRKTKIPFVITHHDHQLKALKIFVKSAFSEWTFGDFNIFVTSYPLQDISIKICLNNSDHIIVPGFSTLEYMKRIYRNLDIEKTSVIYNGVNFNQIDRIDNGPAQDAMTIIYYGQLLSRKGILHLIRSFSILIRDFPDLRLEIFGTGPLKDRILELVSKLDLQNAVGIHGYVPYPRLISEIRKAGVVVLPSLHEVGPWIAALEAMACKKPLVTFDLPFTREFVSNMHNAVLAQAEDVTDLAEKIGLVLKDEKLRRRLSQNAHDYVRKEHDWDRLVERYIDIYERCV